MITAEQRGVVPDGTLPYVTAGIDVRFLRPSPLHEPIELLAWAASADENQILVESELWWEGKVRAAAHSSWKRWRPRRHASGGRKSLSFAASAPSMPERNL